MATRTYSQTGESTETFIQQNLLKNPKKEIFAFDNADIAPLRASGAFPDGARVLLVLNQIKNLHCPDLCIEDIPIVYRLRSHGSSRFLLFSTSIKPLILKATKNEDGWQRKFFFVKRDSIYEGASLPVEWPISRANTFLFGFYAMNFKEVAPLTKESEKRIEAIYRLPESDRSFSTHLPVPVSIYHLICLVRVIL
ncbi:hypothetical protein Hanom_Chr17g01581371 [Helianthus anomalus]